MCCSPWGPKESDRTVTELNFFFYNACYSNWPSQVALVVNNPPANAGDARDESLIPG